jgi:hypothetical protein
LKRAREAAVRRLATKGETVELRSQVGNVQ